MFDRCSSCDLEFEPRPGDTWAFWVFGDRVFLAMAIASIYFGVRPASLEGRVAFFAIVIGAIILTMPQRQGICTALDYFFRLRFSDESL